MNPPVSPPKKIEKLNDVLETQQFKQALEEIYKNFGTTISSLQNMITAEFLKGLKLLDNLGEDLPQEDIDKIYYVHCQQDIKDTPGKRKRKVVASIQILGEGSPEYKLALEYRMAKSKIKLTNFFKSYISNNISETTKSNTSKISNPVDKLRSELDNSANYKAEMEKVEMEKARRASEKLRKERAREQQKALEFAAKAGVIAVLDNNVAQSKKDLISQFDRAVRFTKSELEKMKEENENFDPKKNVDNYKQLVANVMALLQENNKEENKQEEDQVSITEDTQLLSMLKAAMEGIKSTQPANVA